MVEAGMPPLFTIQAATTHAAQLLKHEGDIGSISTGRYADVIAVPGNPLDDITLLQKVNFVMKGGKVYAVAPKPSAAVAQVAAATASPEELEGF